MPESIAEVLKVIKEDWSKLPNFPKFCFLNGVFIILAGWLFNTEEVVFHRTLNFWLIALLIFFVFVLPGIYWVLVELKVLVLRHRWPLEKIGKDYSFLKLKNQDAVLIKDTNSNVHWVENGRTMYDLGFEPYYRQYWEEIDSLEKNTYTFKRGIRTRRKPGGLSKENS